MRASDVTRGQKKLSIFQVDLMRGTRLGPIRNNLKIATTPHARERETEIKFDFFKSYFEIFFLKLIE